MNKSQGYVTLQNLSSLYYSSISIYKYTVYNYIQFIYIQNKTYIFIYNIYIYIYIYILYIFMYNIYIYIYIYIYMRRNNKKEFCNIAVKENNKCVFSYIYNDS